MKTQTDLLFTARVQALSDSATHEQGEALVDWIASNYPRHMWGWCANFADHVPGVYNELHMRMGEWGV